MTDNREILEQELDQIILSEINARFARKPRQINPLLVSESIEDINREIVLAHQGKSVAMKLAAFFSSWLRFKEGGSLCLSKKDVPGDIYSGYMDRKSRFEVLLTAALNALDDPDYKEIFHDRNILFEESYQIGLLIKALTQSALAIEEDCKKSKKERPRNEEEAVSFLREIGPHKAKLQEIKSRHIEFKQNRFNADTLKQLQNAIHLGEKSIKDREKKALEFLFDHATFAFQRFRSMKSQVLNIDSMLRLKDELNRYLDIFRGLSDRQREEQLVRFIATMDKTLEKLQVEVAKEKKREAAVSKKELDRVEDAYGRFLEIKEKSSSGELAERAERKKAVKALKGILHILKSNAQRIKARDVERFLNSTGLLENEEQDRELKEALFYKRAFYTLLPFTIGLIMVILAMMINMFN